MVTIIIPFTVDAAKLDAAKACIEKFVLEIGRNEPDTLVYQSYQDVNNPLRFVHHMKCTDAAAHECHRSSLYLKAFVDMRYPCCTERPDLRYVELFQHKAESADEMTVA